MDNKHDFQLVAAPFTPFAPNGSLALGQISPMARMLHKNGVTGVFVCGTTGESSSLTVAERKLVTTEWVRVRAPSLQIIAHVGHNCLADACELAEHAAACGADAVGMMAPGFLRPATLEDLVACCAQVAAAAPDLPFY